MRVEGTTAAQKLRVLDGALFSYKNATKPRRHVSFAPNICADFLNYRRLNTAGVIG